MAEQHARGGRVTPPTAPSDMRLLENPSKISVETRDESGDSGLQPNETVPAIRRKRRATSNQSPADAILYAGQITRSAASFVIRRESEKLRLHCNMYQQRGDRFAPSTYESERSSASASSRPLPGLHSAAAATDHPHSRSSNGSSTDVAFLEPDATRLWLRACRTKRMALLLRELEITRQLLADELRRVEADEDDNVRVEHC